MLLVIFVLLGGCASVKSVRYADEQVYPATNPQDIKVFHTAPPRQYIEIGEVSVEAPIYDIVETIKKLRVRVSEMGGEAVILRLNEAKGIVIRFK